MIEKRGSEALVQVHHVYNSVMIGPLVNDDMSDSCTSTNTVGLNISHVRGS